MLPEATGFFDAGQIEQALINLLKNAAESGGPAHEVTISIEPRSNGHAIVVCDRGRE
jgi:signal transduction histidine kinase